MSGATKEIGAPEFRISKFQWNFVLTPRAQGSQTRYLDPWSPLASSFLQDVEEVNFRQEPAEPVRNRVKRTKLVTADGKSGL